MRRDHLRDLLAADPFEPFRLKLINGDIHDVFDPQTVSPGRHEVFIALPDLNWVSFAYDKINSVESLISDYQGQLAEHQPPS
jgi:hypothetical protein